MLCAAAFAAVAVAPLGAQADDDTDSFTVSANVLATCEISANDLDFGDYNPIAASHLDAQTTLSLTCTNGTPYNVGLNLGDGSGSTIATRYMEDDDDNLLSYTLYQNAGRTLLWGQASNRLAGTGTGTAATIDVFGRVPMQQTAPAGEYEDTIVVTVTW